MTMVGLFHKWHIYLLKRDVIHFVKLADHVDCGGDRPENNSGKFSQESHTGSTDIENEGSLKKNKCSFNFAISAMQIRFEALSSDKTALFFRSRIPAIGSGFFLLYLESKAE
jgi:hypothetical protein